MLISLAMISTWFCLHWQSWESYSFVRYKDPEVIGQFKLLGKFKEAKKIWSRSDLTWKDIISLQARKKGSSEMCPK